MLAMGTHVGIFSATTLLAATGAYALVKAIRAIISIGSEFTKSLAATSAIVGVSRDQLSGLTEQMFELAETTKFTTTQVADGSMEMARAADIAANAMFGFQLKAQDLSRVVDTLAFAATNSNTTVQQLGNALSFAAPVAAAANAEFSEVAGMLAVMADSGVKASRAGTTLRRAYVNLLDPSEKATTVFRDLGVTLRDETTGQMRSMISILEDFTKAGGNAVDITRIFGVRAAPGMIAVWKDMAKAIAGGDAKLADFLKRLKTEGIGASGRMRDAMEKNLTDTWLKFTSVLSVKATRAFLLVEDGLISLVEKMTKFVKSSGDLGVGVALVAVHLREWEHLFKSLPKLVGITDDHVKSLNEQIEKQSNLFENNMSFVGKALRDLPINILALFRIAILDVGRDWAKLVINMQIGGQHIKKFWVEVTGALVVIWKETVKNLTGLLDPMFAWLAEKSQDLAVLARDLPGGDNLANKLGSLSQFFKDMQGGPTAAKELAAEISERARAIAAIDAEMVMLRGLKAEVNKAHLAQMDVILAERDARLESRDATLKQIKTDKLRADQNRRIAKERQSMKVFDHEGGIGPTTGRKPLVEPPTDLLGESVKELKQFIKLQKVSIEQTKMQITNLVAMKEISVFEALEANIQKENNALEATRAEYQRLLAPLEKFRDLAFDGGYKTRAREYTIQIEKLNEVYQVTTTRLEKSVNKQENALIRLRDKYRLVTDAAGNYRIEVNRQRKLSESELLAGVDQIREEGTSPGAKATRDFTERQRVLDEAFAHEQTVFKGHKELMLLSEQEYQARSLQLQIQGAAKQADLWGGYHTEIFNLAESVRQRDLQGSLSHGIAALDQAGRTNKKAFELSKKAKIAQAVIATYTGAAEALKWGYPMGPIFAGMIAAMGAIQIKAIQSTSFGGGSGSVKTSSGSVSTPSASIPTTPGPSQSDALFNQTNTGGQPNTVDSSGMSQDVTLKFEFSAVDAKGIDQLIKNKAPQIVGIVQSAYNERGKTGGPIT
jgi:TP901 family phage tail tape measure protein